MKGDIGIFLKMAGSPVMCIIFGSLGYKVGKLLHLKFFGV